jgi:hypothetical protein
VAGLAAPAPPQTLCTVDDPRLAELSGLVEDPGGTLWAIPDGGSRTEVSAIDRTTCVVTATRGAPVDPYDPEDLAVAPDGALWVADIGDNDRGRDTVAVIVLPVAGPPVLHRLTYPDGPHDAEAFVLDGAGRPVIVTKEGPFGSAAYRTAAPPAGPGPVPLVKVGPIALPPSTGVDGPLGELGSRFVTGAARSADGRVVALRTYTDAWLYPVHDGDVAAAFATAPVQVPLPGEPQGEAVAFGANGDLYSSGERRGGSLGELRVVPGAAALVGTAPTTAVPAPDAAPPPVRTPSWLPAAVGGGAVVAVLLALVVAMSLRAARRR